LQRHAKASQTFPDVMHGRFYALPPADTGNGVDQIQIGQLAIDALCGNNIMYFLPIAVELCIRTCFAAG
jgi:hypothetical protein